MKIVSECLFCGSPRHVLRFEAPDRWFEVQGLYKVFECSDCGLLFLNPQPTPEELAAHYPSGYYSLEGDRPGDLRDEQFYEALYGRNSSLLKRIRFSPYRLVLRTMIGRAGQRMLDVGCGSGHFLAMAKRVLNVETYGVELFGFDAAFAEKNNLKIFQGTLQQAAFPDQFFDVITLNHVFEHIADPRSALRELRRILKDGGTLILAVPQKACVLYWLFGKSWVQLDIPRHLFVPSRKNLEALAISLGFKLRGVRYNGRPEPMLDTIFYWQNGIRGRKRYLPEHKSSQLAFRAMLPFAYLFNFLRIGDQIELLLTTDGPAGGCTSAPSERN